MRVYSDNNGMLNARSIESAARTLYGRRAVIEDRWGKGDDTVYVVSIERADGTISKPHVDWLMAVTD